MENIKLIITGHDYAGKSTILKQLWEKYNNGKMSYIHLSYREPTNKFFYESTLEYSSFLMDRCFLDELVYPEVFGREQNLSYDDAHYLHEKCHKKKIPLLIFTCSEEEIKKRVLERNNVTEEPEVLQNIFKIREKYLQIAKYFDLPVIDTTGKTPEEILAEVEDYLYEYNRPLMVGYY